MSELLAVCENSNLVSHDHTGKGPRIPPITAQKFLISKGGNRITFRGVRFSIFPHSYSTLYWESTQGLHSLVLSEEICYENCINSLFTMMCDIVMEVREDDEGVKLVASVENVSETIGEA